MGKGILLYSGGLDSLLAAKILIEQGLDITGFHCILPFVQPDLDPSTLKSSIYAQQIGLKLVYYRCGKDYLEMVRSPKHGHGKNYNPCIDCKIHFIKKAAQYMHKTGADFVATGEVMGQRPMSQLKHMLRHIEKESLLEGRLLRPLCARNLEPTIPEREGLVDRDRLLDISGRSRKRQFELAEKFGIKEFASPAGGCLLTDPKIAGRVRDLLEHHSDYTQLDVYLLTIGRHFRITDNAKIIVARNEDEYIELEKYHGSAQYILVPDFKGPFVFCRGFFSEADLMCSASILRRYAKIGSVVNPVIRIVSKGRTTVIDVPDMIEPEKLEVMRI